MPVPRECPLSQGKPHLNKRPGDLSRTDNVARARPVKSVFLNIPYDVGFEDRHIAYIVGLTQLGLRINAAIALPNQGRLTTIIRLIEESDFSNHDLSRIELSRGVPRFNMPVELGLALYCSHAATGRHRESAQHLSELLGSVGRNRVAGRTARLRRQDSTLRDFLRQVFCPFPRHLCSEGPAAQGALMFDRESKRPQGAIVCSEVYGTRAGGKPSRFRNKRIHSVAAAPKPLPGRRIKRI